MEQVEVTGIAIHNLKLKETVSVIEDLIQQHPFSYTVTANVDHLVIVQDNHSFRRAYDAATLVVCDGVPVLWAAKFLGKPLKGRVNGTDLFEALVEKAAVIGASIFLLGGDEGVAEQAAQVLKERHPGLLVSGVYCPPHGFEHDEAENARIVSMIQKSQPTYLFVGVGSPKQELWIHRFGASTGAKHAVGIGASFGFVAGVIPRAPKWMQRSGLEWLWRLTREPKRLWRRYLLNDPKFFLLVLSQKVRQFWVSSVQ